MMAKAQHPSKIHPSGRKKYEPKDIRGFIQLNQTFIQFDTAGTVEIKGAPLTADEMAAIAHVSELLRRLRTGKVITYDFDPLAFQDGERMISCEWLPSGNLKLNMDDSGENPRQVNKRYDHAFSISQAMSKHRTFTCSLNLYMMLPRRRAPHEHEPVLADAEFGEEDIVSDTDVIAPNDEVLLASEQDIQDGRTKPAEEILEELGGD
jgi:hypothetical protein